MGGATNGMSFSGTDPNEIFKIFFGGAGPDGIIR